MKTLSRGESPKIYIAETADKQKNYLETAIKQLVDKKVKDIVILTCKTESTSSISQFCIDGNIFGMEHLIDSLRAESSKGLKRMLLF